MKNLFNLKSLSVGEIVAILKRAEYIEQVGWAKINETYPYFKNYTFATAFLEPSTRTQFSFLYAAQKLKLNILQFRTQGSTLLKKETFEDIIKTLMTIGIDIVAIRHFETEFYKKLTNLDNSIINAGDGIGSHPTQCLLDLYTIWKEFGRFEGLKVLIIGDVKHSRVARSGFHVFQRLDMEVVTCAPDVFRTEEFKNISDIDQQKIEEFDIVLMLRYQHERHDQVHQIENQEFFKKWGLTKARYDRLKSSAIIMHPGPVNRNVEIDSDLVEAPKSKIFEQVKNGVYVRAALISLILESK